MIDEPMQARLLRLIWRVTGRKQKIDQFFAGFLKYRKYLPECDAHEVIPHFPATQVVIQQPPIGTWSTPLIDVFVLVKSALGFHSKRILELGSYRGDTAKTLAQNTGDDVTVCAVDINEQHGAAYRGTDLERKIQRKTGSVSPALFAPGEKYDMIFVDADHDLASVMNDTKVAFSVLADQGVILWHDYAHDCYFHGMCGVPEALQHFAKEHAIYAIRGTRLAIFSNVKGFETATLAARISSQRSGSVWEDRQIRG